MPLSAGDRLGPYEILAPIGAGGMGEVYRALDTKLKRDVALKVLPEAFAQDPDRMLRFQREAEVLASLNHPNIAHIHGVEERALVMELVEGETLPAGLPLEIALNYARQIAEALEYAHERGVIHRDLKPANVKITPEGVVKLLDFGLAKAIEDPSSASGDPVHSPTLTIGATRIGVILGTAAYMSPEQASGKTADRRADIWSFGAVLYEMLSGKRAFEGESASDTLASVLKLDPGWGALPKETPASIVRLLRRCLTKDRKQRLQAIGEARIALEGPAAEEAAATPPVRSGVGNIGWIAAAVLGLAAVFAGVLLWRSTRPVERPLVRLEVDLGPDVSLPSSTNTTASSVILSPDGTRIVYASGNPARLFTRRLDQTKANELGGTQGATDPFYSPDGQWVGFFIGDKMNKISVEGGAVVPLADIPNRSGADWGSDGGIIAAQALNGLVRVPAGGGAPTTVLGLSPGELALVAPQILPGGKAVLFTAFKSLDFNAATIEVFSFADRRRKTLVQGGTAAHYLPSGHLVYTNKGTLFAIAFDVNRLETRGTAVPLLDDVAYGPLTGFSDVNASATGTLVYHRSSSAASTLMTVQWLNIGGKKEPLLAKPGVYTSIHLSPDGKRLALLVMGGSDQDVWVYDPQRDAKTRLTFDGVGGGDPIWTPDGRNVVFASVGKGIFWTRADGAGQPQPLIQSKYVLDPWSFTPDGKHLAYLEIQGPPQIWTVPVEEQGGQLKAGKPEQFLKTHFADMWPAFSPDGRWLAYESNESGSFEVYVRAFPPPASGQGGKWQISNAGGTDPGRGPMWSRSGHEILYSAGDQLMAVSYAVRGDTFVNEKPQLWLDKLGGQQYQLAPDGKRVAVLTPVATPEAPKQEHTVVFLENFFDELRRKVPLGGK